MNNINVTNCSRGDGFGAQYYNIIWAILYSELKGYKFYNRNVITSSKYRWPWKP